MIWTGPRKSSSTEAFRQGSPDNLTDPDRARRSNCRTAKPARSSGNRPNCRFLRCWKRRMMFDGYRIVRELHGSSRSHIYLAVDTETDTLVAIKIPSIDLRDDPAYLKRFMMEEWVARRIDSPHVLKPCLHSRKRNYLYVVTEFIDGQTLTQWMIDNPQAGSGNGARDRRANRQGLARLSPQGDAASGPQTRQHHDRQDGNGEDHRFRLDQDHGRRRSRAARRP